MALSFEQAAGETLRHVVAQSRGRRLLYPDHAARAAVARRLADSCARHRLKCLVWCVTDRRLHCVLRGPAAAITLATHEIAGSRPHHGHWQSTVVRRDLYLLELTRHALLAPVRAGLCRQVADWPYSSARESLGLRPPPAWLDVAPVYALLGADEGGGTARLRRFIASG